MMLETLHRMGAGLMEPPLQLLEDLASRQAQVRWIIDGAEGDHIWPRQMLDDGVRFCDWILESGEPTTARQRDAVKALLAAIQVSMDSANLDSNFADLIEIDPAWQLVRSCAATTLRAFEALPYD